MEDIYPVDYSNSTLSDEEMIQREYDALIYDYEHSNHRKKVEVIQRAFTFARMAHEGVRRKSGEPYIMHPLAVARIVCREIGLGSTSIVSTLLHDVIEDTEYTEEDIEQLFGPKVAQIVLGLTKISSEILDERNIESLQAENFRKLILTMNADIRVILIKIADRLHNMRTLSSMPEHKKLKITGETLYIYAPLAHRLGLFAIKTELEELVFKHEHPKAYEDICNQIIDTEQSRAELFKQFSTPIHPLLKARGLDYEMKTRVKSCYSIWKKMQKKQIPFQEIYDLYAVRIIFEETPGLNVKETCWGIYTDITGLYRVNNERTRDWVAQPKSNGYRALHFTVMGPTGKWIEVQVRSRKMDEIDERGLAAHWKYKSDGVEEDQEITKFLDQISELLENPDSSAMDFLDTIKLNLYGDDIMVFTPKGDPITLPHESTPLDFAYALHSTLGQTCIGAKVNHKLVPLSHTLQSGDQVEIISSNNQKPSALWLKYVKTAKAKSKINEFLRTERRKLISQGEESVINYFEQHDLSVDAGHMDLVAALFGFHKREDLFYAVGSGTVNLVESLYKRIKSSKSNRFFKSVKEALIGKQESMPKPTETISQISEIDYKKPYLLQSDAIKSNYVMADDCNPLPGDEVVAFVIDNQVVVHQRTCTEAMRLKSSTGNKLLSTIWGDQGATLFTGSIMIEGIDSKGILNGIVQVITEDFLINIASVQLQTQDGIFGGKVGLEVHSAEQVEQLCAALKQAPGISNAYRVY